MARLLWTQVQDFGPAPRYGHALAFDTQNSCVVLFGGNALVTGTNASTALAGDTWGWDGDNWTQLNDIGPSPRQMFAMAFDRNRNRLVLFGGLTGSASSGETWEWDGQNWTQVSETGPKARILHAMAFDSSKNLVTLYGGQLQQGDPAQETSFLNDTWDWNGQNWTQQEDTGPNRCAQAMAYDDNRQRLVLFGGNDAKATQVRRHLGVGRHHLDATLRLRPARLFRCTTGLHRRRMHSVWWHPQQPAAEPNLVVGRHLLDRTPGHGSCWSVRTQSRFRLRSSEGCALRWTDSARHWPASSCRRHVGTECRPRLADLWLGKRADRLKLRLRPIQLPHDYRLRRRGI